MTKTVPHKCHKEGKNGFWSRWVGEEAELFKTPGWKIPEEGADQNAENAIFDKHKDHEEGAVPLKGRIVGVNYLINSLIENNWDCVVYHALPENYTEQFGVPFRSN